MSLSSHLSILEAKHRDLDDKIRSEQRSPNTNDIVVTGLKRSKLRIKDEITRIRSSCGSDQGFGSFA